MKLKVVVAFLFLCLNSLVFAATSDDEYKVSMTVVRDGAILSKPTVGVRSGQQAEVLWEDENNPDQSFRMLLTVTPSAAQLPSKSIVDLKTSFFESVQREWVLRGEPQLGIALEEPASFTLTNDGLKRQAPKFEVSVTISKMEAGGPTAGIDEASPLGEKLASASAK
jgi:hypothetical protein